MQNPSMAVHNMGPSIESFPENAFPPSNKSLTELMTEGEKVPILAGITEEEGYDVFSLGT